MEDLDVTESGSTPEEVGSAGSLACDGGLFQLRRMTIALSLKLQKTKKSCVALQLQAYHR